MLEVKKKKSALKKSGDQDSLQRRVVTKHGLAKDLREVKEFARQSVVKSIAGEQPVRG